MSKNLESDYFSKITKFAKLIGKDLIFKSLLLFYALKENTTPKWAKATIVSALGYLILPLDAIPDFIPVLGYSDDLSIIVLALGTVYLSINETVKENARQRYKLIFTEEYK